MLGFGFDPFGMLITLIGLPMIFLPQMWVKNTYNKYKEFPTAAGQTGAQVAKQILQMNGLEHVSVEETPGQLSDHYDPGARAVRLSPENFSGRSVAAATIAAHEVGHAIQHARGYVPVVIRSQMFPAVNIGSQLGPLLIMAGLMLPFFMKAAGPFAYYVALAGVAFFGLSVAFHLVTLPVEFDASARGLKVLENSQFLTAGEMPGAKKVLTAAAMTYVSAALYSLMELVYYIIRINGMRERE